MVSGRFFVTNVLLLATASFLACTTRSEKPVAQVVEGNQQIQVAARTEQALQAEFKISFSRPRFDWKRLSKDQRQAAKEKLAEYVSAVTRVFEIDAKKDFYLTEKASLQKQLEAAMMLQKSLDSFERTYGENFDPQKPKDHA